MTRARRDYRSDGDEHEPEATEDSPPPMELRYVYTPAHSELQWRVPNGEWQSVRSVKLENADEGETIEGTANVVEPSARSAAEDVTGQRQLAANLEANAAQAQQEKKE